MAQVKFIRGTREQYNALVANTAKKQDVINSVFFVTDDQVIMMNEKQYGGATGTLFDGFVKNLDVEGQTLTYHKDVSGVDTTVTIKLIEAADNSIVIGDITKGADGNSDGVKDGSTIKVNVKTIEKGADGLKLGADGLYVDLVKTTADISANTKAIADEVTRAKNAEKANATAINQEVTNREVAINGLNAEIKGGAGKFIQSVKEEKGVITAVEADLTAAAVAYDKTSDKVIAKATDVSAAIKELDAKVAENKAAELTYKTVKLTAEEVTALANGNVKEAYKVVSVDKVGKETTVGDIIKIYKDSSLKSIDYVKNDDKQKAGQFLKYVYTLEDGTEKTVYVDMSELVDQAEVENGIQAIDGKLSIKVAEDNEADFLTVDANGLKLSGVKAAIGTAQKAVQDKLDVEITRAKGEEKKNADAIGVNAAAIAKLNGTAATDGSVAKAVADAKTELLGDAATEYNTLGKLEDKIQALDDKATKAHTEVVAKTSGHVTVAVADSTDSTHKVVTIRENDIASATGLTAEVSRAQNAEDKIEASVGLAADGSHVKTNDNYTSGATTVVGEIAALDKQVKKNADNITTISGNVTTNASDITELKKTVSGHTTSINTLNGEETAAGSVKHTAKGYADTALANAKAYTDTSLTWIDAGTYGTEV